MKYEVITSQEYNRRAYMRYRKDVDEYNPNEGGFPYIGFYIFEKPNGEPRNYGYVLSLDCVTEFGGQWFKTKKEAYKRLEEKK